MLNDSIVCAPGAHDGNPRCRGNPIFYCSNGIAFQCHEEVTVDAADPQQRAGSYEGGVEVGDVLPEAAVDGDAVVAGGLLGDGEQGVGHDVEPGRCVL